MPGAPSSFLLLVVRPGAPSSVLATRLEETSGIFLEQHLPNHGHGVSAPKPCGAVADAGAAPEEKG